MERHNLLLFSFGYFGQLIQYFQVALKGIGNGDSWNLQWYDNATAVGNQIYPSGIHKYYDLFSLNGIFIYFYDYTYVLLCWMLSPLLPLDIVVMSLTLDMDSWFKAYFIEMNPILYEICSFV